MLEAGTYAPSGRGLQSPILVAVQEPETKKRLIKMNAEIMGTDTDPYYGAPTLILVFAPVDRTTYIEDGSCVLDTMMLAAHSIGLASCWIHREKEMFATTEGKALMKKWGVPENFNGIGALALGYADGRFHRLRSEKRGVLFESDAPTYLLNTKFTMEFSCFHKKALYILLSPW